MQVYDHKHETMALKTSHTPEPQYDHSSDKNISVTIISVMILNMYMLHSPQDASVGCRIYRTSS